MSITVYVDILFLLNLIIDYIILSSTAFISNKKSSTIRFLSAAMLGALYSTLIFFPTLKTLNIIIFKIIISFLMVLIAFKWQSFAMQAKLFIIYYIINFIYGGGMYAFYRFTSLGSKMNYSNGEYYINLPLWAIILLALFFYFLIKLFGRILNGASQNSVIKEIEITVGNKSVCTNALIDTGNSLYDPISQLPVMLVEKKVLKKVMDIESIDFSNCNYNNIKKYNLRIVPFYDASGNSSIIYAFTPTRISDVTDKREINNTLIGISEHSLSDDRSYQALMHSKQFIKE